MRRLIPRTLWGRVSAVLLVGLTVSQILAQLITDTGRSDALTLLEGYEIVEHVTSISRLVEQTPPPERARVLRALDRASLHVRWIGESAVASVARHDSALDMIREVIALNAPHLAPERIRVAYASAANAGAGPAIPETGASSAHGGQFRRIFEDIATGRHFLISVRLSDGTWLEFELPYIASLSPLSLRFALAIAAMAVAVLALSVWAVGRVLAPLQAFARASERLGTDVYAPPLAETGPAEIRRVAQSFNRMQGRIRRLVEDRTQMAVALSHDLRTPITRLRLRAETIEDPAIRQSLVANLEELERLVGAALSFGADTAETDPRSVVDLAAMLRDIEAEFRELGGSVRVVAPPSLPYLCRAVSIRRCFVNLIGNAVKHGGNAEVALTHTGPEIVLSVEDRGPGIPAEERERVFRPFVRLSGAGACDQTGFGLGLSVARTIARAHGGDVRLADREPGPGLRAVVMLPVSPAD